MSQMLSPAFGVLIYYIGVMLENSRRNWFVGIRTPWTMSSEGVWDKTNKLGGKMMKTAGVVAFFGVVFPNFGFWLILVPTIAAALYYTIYSYTIYRKEQKRRTKLEDV